MNEPATQTQEAERTNGTVAVVDPAQVPARPPKAPIAVGQKGLELRSFDDMYRFSNILASSDLAPKDYRGKPHNVMIAVQLGMELGISPMQAVQNIAPINGRPSVWGDLALALCEASGLLEAKKEWFEGNFGDDDFKAIIETKRRGREPHRSEFSIKDAKTAKLWGKAGPWETNPKRMLQMRARGFNLRDQFSDILKGLVLAEEAIDITPENEPVAAEPGAVEGLAARLDAAASQSQEIDSAGAVAAVAAADDTTSDSGASADPAIVDRVLGVLQRMNGIKPGAGIEALRRVAGQESLDGLSTEKLEEIATVFEAAIADLEAKRDARTDPVCACPDGPAGKHVDGCHLKAPAAEPAGAPKPKAKGLFGDQ